MTTFYVKVIPDQDERRINLSGTYPVISLTTPAAQGQANTELVQFLEELLDVNVGILAGHQSRRKKLVADRPREEILETLAGHR